MTMSLSGSMSSFATSSAARPPPPPPPPPENSDQDQVTPGQDMLSLLDADESGDLSLAEIADSRLSEIIGDDYDAVDVDGNGLLSLEELEAHAETAMAKNGDRPPPPPGDADAASLIEGLFASLELDETTEETSTLNSIYADSSYAAIQEMISAAA